MPTIKLVKVLQIEQIIPTIATKFLSNFQNVYFHTSAVSTSVVVVVELVASGLDEAGKLKKVSSGWGIIRPFMEENLPDTGRNVKLHVTKYAPHYNGEFHNCQS